MPARGQRLIAEPGSGRIANTINRYEG